MVNTPSPYAEVNEILLLLLTRVKHTLGKQFTAMYLYGSLASGDFNPKSSDIDFVVVTESNLAPENLANQAKMGCAVTTHKAVHVPPSTKALSL